VVTVTKDPLSHAPNNLPDIAIKLMVDHTMMLEYEKADGYGDKGMTLNPFRQLAGSHQ
jgi:hypothetical protein